MPTRVKPLIELPYTTKFLELLTNIRLGWKWLEVTNTLALKTTVANITTFYGSKASNYASGVFLCDLTELRR
jgi:hypothetical protein